MPRLSGSELLRKSIHIAAGVLVIGLRWVDPIVLVPIAAAGLLFNLAVLPRVGGRQLWRADERSAGASLGIVLYPFSVLLLLIVFRSSPAAIAAGWGALAFGDGAAALAGQLWGGARLPWNSDKTWAGFLGFWIVASGAIWSLVQWVSPLPVGSLFLASIAVAVALVAAGIESSGQRFDDNLAVPLVAALTMWCLLPTEGSWHRLLGGEMPIPLLSAASLNVAFAIAGLAIGGLTLSGAAAAWLIGTLVLWTLGIPGYAVLLTFFLVGTLSTRIGRIQKSELGVAEKRGGRRRAANALANGGVATFCAVVATVSPHSDLFVAGSVASLAAGCADTVESELGQLWGRPTLLITTLQPVPAGTDGGVSAVGTLCGLAAGIFVAGVGAAGGLFAWSLVLPLGCVALVATLFESVVGATLERRGLLDNQGVNFFNTSIAAISGALVAWVVL